MFGNLQSGLCMQVSQKETCFAIMKLDCKFVPNLLVVRSIVWCYSATFLDWTPIFDWCVVR